MYHIIWVIWPTASWKDTVAQYISNKLKIPFYQISQPLKEIAKQRNIPITRENLITLWRELAQKYWDEFLAKYLVENAKENKLILVWMRQLWQLDWLRKYTNFVLIWVNADPLLRFERILKRNKPWDPKTFEEFLKLEQKDDWESVQKISECMKQVDFLIENEWSLKQLYKKVDEILKKLKHL